MLRTFLIHGSWSVKLFSVCYKNVLSFIYLHFCCVKLLINISGIIVDSDVGILRVSKDWTSSYS